MKRNQGVPQIDSEIQIALALLQWTPRQLAEFTEVLGAPVAAGVIEEAMTVPIDRFGLSAQPGVLAAIKQAFACLGLRFSTTVFGVVRQTATVRVPLIDSCSSMAAVVGHLFKSIPKAQVSIAVQRPGGRRQMPRFISLVMETPFGSRLLFDTPAPAASDAEEILALAYATDLTRVCVATACIDRTAVMEPDAAAAAVLSSELRPAANVPRSRMLELLGGAD